MRQHSQQTPRRTSARPAGRALQLLLATLMIGLAACGGGILGGGGAPVPSTPASGTVSGEVERVEAYANEIDLWTEDRRIFTVRYSDDTPVYYRGERYTPAELEAGDLVTVRYETVGSGERVAQRIDVDQGRQDRPGGGDDPYDPGEDDPYDPNDDEVATLNGEVEHVDTSAREIEIDSGRERVTFGYRDDTVVYYQGERYRVENLEPGDVIRTRVERDYRGDWITDSITVERSRQERGIDDPWDPDDGYDPGDDRYGEDEGVRYAGTVEEVDTRRGEFVLRTERYGLKTIVMPYNASRADRQAFDDLRRGDRVRVEAEPLDRSRAELLRFGWR